MQKDMGITFGIVMIFQSQGQGLSYKPHMHCIVTDHGMNKDKKWVHCKTLSYNMLRDSVREILIPHIIKKMYPWWRNQVRKILETCDDKKWTVYPAIHKFSGERIVNYLSKSVSGVVLDIENDLDFNREEMTYTIRDRYMLDERTTTLDAHTFWDRYLNHIPPKGAVTIRNYGLYSNRYKEVLERIRIDEYGMESSRKEIIDYEEECGSCHGKMVRKEAFSYPDIPLIMRLYIQKNNSPPEHGFSFQTGKMVLT